MKHKETQVVYLASPFSDPNPTIKKERLDNVNKVTAKLMRDEICVFSPLSHNCPLFEYGVQTSREWWMKFDLAMLSRCNKLMVLRQEGWDKSLGVQEEIKTAKELGIPVEYIDIE